MESTENRAIAIVGVGAVLPDALNAAAFWNNIKQGRYSITEVPPDRWDPALYYDPDPAAPDKTYSKIGGWVREHVWDPMKWHLPIPPRVANAMDKAQQWAISSTREALEDYGYPKRPIDTERTAVILGNAMAGEKHYLTSMRVYFPEYARELAGSASFSKLPESVRREITEELHGRISKLLPEVTEDSMPGELSNCIAGRIANLYNFHGPNFVCDAACASAMAAMTAAIEGLIQHHFDFAVAGGIDRNMGAPTFVKFCKIGALSATGSRPYADGADGFVMGEGTVIFLLRRLADAERDGDKIYAVIRGIAGSSDGKGKGITAPNPVGQKLAVARAWENAGLSPATATYIEGHGTSTKVGDVVEVESIGEVLGKSNLPPHSVALGSVKSNIGHLKGAAGAAGLLKTAFALRNKMLPPSLKFERPNPNIDFAHSPLYVNTELREWKVAGDMPRRAGASAFGFGGTNFHVVLEEHIPGKLNGNGKKSTVNVPAALVHEGIMNTKDNSGSVSSRSSDGEAFSYKAPLRGALVIGGKSEGELVERLRSIQKDAAAGHAPVPCLPAESDLRAPERLAIDYADAGELNKKAEAALKAFAANQPAMWKALRAQGIFRGQSTADAPRPKVAFLYTGQGSQYVNMLRSLRASEPIVSETFTEADRVMTPLLGKPLSEFIYVNEADPAAVAKAEDGLRETEITQPAVLATDISLTRLFAAYGIEPDMTMGHSLGEYGALVASGALPFDEALEAVSARGRGMAEVAVSDRGRMAAVFAPIHEIEEALKKVDGYVVIANINSDRQSVIGGASQAVEQACGILQSKGFQAVPLPVSHAFHTSIVAGASEPLRRALSRLHLQSPRIPIVANVNGEFYPTGPDVVPQMLDILAQQVAAPVQFIKGLRTLYGAGARIFVETGPKKALHGFAEDVLGDRGDVVSFFTNHPKVEDVTAFNQALCGLYAAGLGRGVPEASSQARVEVKTTASMIHEAPPAAATPYSSGVAASAAPMPVSVPQQGSPRPQAATPPLAPEAKALAPKAAAVPSNGDRYAQLGHFFADVLERGWEMYQGTEPVPKTEPVAVTGAALGLPGTDQIFDDGNIARILRGDQFIDVIPTKFRRAMLDKRITRLVKSDNGGPTFESISEMSDVIKLAARGRAFDPEKEFGISADRLAALDRTTCLAIGAGIDALRDAGIPLVMRYKTTSKGTQLPDRWGLPDAMRDDTGVIFGSAFPGCGAFAEMMSEYYVDHARREQMAFLEHLRSRAAEADSQSVLGREIARCIDELQVAIEREPYVFDRRFLFRVLSMGHSQFAEFIGARGPNTQINSACATTSQAIALAEDWIRAGRCRRVVIISADDVTADNLIDWVGAGFLASGAAATDAVVEDAAIPFDRRRHGLIMGMGAAALIVESAEAARERGIQPICEVLSAVTANSAFHGSRLDVQHIRQVMEDVMAKAEACSGINRHEVAPRMVFVSHETYTPARGGSASAEIHALRHVFGDDVDKIVIANTKGMTGHAMGTGIEEVVAVKALETGCVPPVANFKEVDPELGELNLSKGGIYPVDYALRLGAGFGSQISMTLLRWVSSKDGARRSPNALGYDYRIVDPEAWSSWLSRMADSPAAELEVVNRTLRVRDQKAIARLAETAQETRAVPAQTAQARPPVTTPKPAPAPAVSKAPEQTVPVKAAAAAASAAAPSTAAPVASTATAAVAARPIVVATPVVAETKPAAPAPAAAPVHVPTSPAPAEGDSVKERILALVAEKTGYPVDMLDLDLDLEADLGVDTVKQAEVLATVREAYGIARDDSIKLRDFPTLAHIIRFVNERRSKPAEVAPVTAETKNETLATPPPAAIVPPKAHSDDAVRERILELAVEKTGYPRDMLDLELDLEADLGVDTVKQAEMLAAIREIYSIPRDENLKLRDFPTLKHVIQFVYDKRPDLAAAPKAAATAPSTPVAEPLPPEPAPATKHEVEPTTTTAVTVNSVAGDQVKERILDLAVEKTGYPRDMLDLELDLEADLGVDTVKQAEMLAAIREIYSIPRDENLKLRDFPTLGHVIQFVYDKRPDLATVSPSPVITEEPMPTAVEAPTPNPESVTVTASATAPAEDAIKDKVLEIVAEKTGYPKEMLDLDLDMEADLGIDTVKQAEMFAAVRAAFNIPRDEQLKLRDFPTLAHVIRFAQGPAAAASAPAPNAPATEQKGEQTTVAQAPPPSSAPPPVVATRAALRLEPASFEATNRIPRRVPIPALRPELRVCKSTGVKLGPGSRVLIKPDKGGVGEALAARLKAMGVEVLWMDNAPDDTQAEQLNGWLAAGPVQGVYWLPALDHEGNLREMDPGIWHAALQVRLKSFYATMRILYEQIAKPGTFLVSATRLGGQHGYDQAGAVAPLGGAVTGFTKTYKRERMEVLVKAVDFEAERNASEVAQSLIDETFRDPGAVEVGYREGLRWTVTLGEQPAADGQAGLKLDGDSVFVITGAAGSIVSAITADLAAASGGTFYLLDLVPEPNPDNPDIKRFVTDKDGLKRDLFARMQARGERATPALVEKELAGLERAHAAQNAIDAVHKAGGTAHYFSVNLTDANGVGAVIEQVRQRSGRIDVLLHAAGMERSHFLPDKDLREFNLVFDVKSDGWFNLLHAIGDMPLGATVVFSSIAGRFGNGGQTDYSSANDLLCKITSSFRSTRPGTRGIAVDWTAWGGIGMATRGSIPKMMELAGIDMLPPEAGVPLIRRELTAGGTCGEIVVAQRLGALLNEWDESGGIDMAALRSSHGPMIGNVRMGLYGGLTIETTLQPTAQPFLYDHRIDGTPVLPGVMGIEAFAEAAACMLPGWHVEAIEDVNFLAPFKFYRDEPRTVTIQVTFSKGGDALVADCRLIGHRQLPNQAQPQEATHFTARVRLTREARAAVTPPAASVQTAPEAGIVEAADIYRFYFHGPAYQVLHRAWRTGDKVVGEMSRSLPANHHPSEQPIMVSPRLIEFCFQTAGLWEMGVQNRFGLPHHVQRVRTVQTPDQNTGPLYAVVKPNPDQGTFDAEVVDGSGTLYVRMSGYRTVALPNAVDAEPLRALRAAA